MRFRYVIDLINESSFIEEPFPHILIDKVFHPADFRDIVSAPEISFGSLGSTQELFSKLKEFDYSPIGFPGCTESESEYLDWEAGKKKHSNVDTCEAFGMVYRLGGAQSNVIQDLEELLQSDEFWGSLIAKFNLQEDRLSIDSGIQKYLNGYEISPHPDVRAKALTFMININPSDQSDSLNFHTHYMKFKPSRKYVSEFWKGNPNSDRAWVPWDWCETVKQQTQNNSMVIFEPSDTTLHAVKAQYDHRETQRTQLYGNLWYKDMKSAGYVSNSDDISRLAQIPWQDLDIRVFPKARMHHNSDSLLKRLWLSYLKP